MKVSPIRIERNQKPASRNRREVGCIGLSEAFHHNSDAGVDEKEASSFCQPGQLRPLFTLSIDNACRVVYVRCMETGRPRLRLFAEHTFDIRASSGI